MRLDMLRTSKALRMKHLQVIEQSDQMDFTKKRQDLCIDFRWHLLYSYNTDFFAPIFPTSSIVLVNTMQSLMTWYFHEASSEVFRSVNSNFLYIPIETSFKFFSRGHATLHLAVLVGRSVGRSVCRSIRHIFKFRAVFASLLLPNRPRLYPTLFFFMF